MIIEQTGNIFFDAGYYMFYHILPDKKDNDFSKDELKKIVDWLINESKRWQRNKSNQFSAFFHGNGKPAIDIAKDMNDRSKALDSIIDEKLNPWIEAIKPADKNVCNICGLYEAITYLSRSEIPLNGSIKNNFFPFWSKGISTCGLCGIKSYASMFSAVKIMSKAVIINTSQIELYKIWINEIARDRETLEKQNLTNEEGPISSPIKTPINAIYNYFKKIVKAIKENGLSTKLLPFSFYYYTNFALGTDFDEFPVNSQMIKFFEYLFNEPYRVKDWNNFVRRWYKLDKKLEFDEKTKSIMKVSKKEKLPAEEEDYHDKRNIVIHNLMNYQSIVRYFINTKEKRIYLDFNIIEKYFEVILLMEKDQIKLIKDISDLIAESIRSEDMKLFSIEKINSYASLRREFILLNKKYIIKNGKPLFTFDEFIEKLIPKVMEWRLVKDLIIIRLYEQLADVIQKLPEEEQKEVIPEGEENE